MWTSPQHTTPGPLKSQLTEPTILRHASKAVIRTYQRV